MDNIYNKTYQIIEKMDMFSLREKLLLLVTGLVGIGAFMYELYIGPNISKIATLKEQQQHTTKESSAYRQEIAYLTVTQKKEHTALQKKNHDLMQELQTVESGYFGHRSMPKVLANILSDFKGLELVSLESLSPEQQSESAALIKRPYRLHFVGGFPEMIKYLYRLKTDVPSVLWENFEYQIKAFPNADIKLTLYTLNYEKTDHRGQHDE